MSRPCDCGGPWSGHALCECLWDMFLLASSSETYLSLSGLWIRKDTGSFVWHIKSQLLHIAPGIFAKEGLGQVATGSECYSASDHRNPETQAWSFTAVAWWSALADDCTAGAVQACGDCSSVSSVPSSKLRLLRANLRSFRPPTSLFGQLSQTEYSAVVSQYFWTQAFSVAVPTVWNPLPDPLRDPAVESERFR